MEPRIRYARAADGTHIACSVMGKGSPLVYASNVWGDLQWYLHDELSRVPLDQLVDAGWMVVRYDGRGMGSSDRDVSDFSLDARIQDLDAVVQHAGVETFALCGYGQGGPAAIAYSITHPGRVSHLILVNSFASGAAYYDTIPAMRALINLHSMAQDQWEFFTNTLATAATGFQDADRARRTADLFRRSMSASAFMQYVNGAREIDVTALLPQVPVPTLVVQDSSGFGTDALSRQLAADIPDAYYVSTDDYIAALREFVLGKALGEDTPEPSPAGAGMAVVLFTDIADSTPLTERLGDAAFRQISRTLDERVRAAIRDRGGTPVEGKVLGDGVMGVFSSAARAIEAARLCVEVSAELELPLHIGIHAGDVIHEEGNVYGGAVNIASRICALCEPGEVLVSQTVRDLARTSAGVSFEDRGDKPLKGIADPVRLFTVRAT